MVPIVHLPVSHGQNVLLVGKGSGAAADVALRYPTTSSVLVVDEQVSTKDKRVQAARLDQLPTGWNADLAIVVVPTLTDTLVGSVRKRHEANNGVAVFAVAQPALVRRYRELLKQYWSVVQPYREYLPGQKDPQWFLMAGDHGFKRYRPVPGWTSRLTDKYLPVLFTFSKDEYALSFGNAA